MDSFQSSSIDTIEQEAAQKQKNYEREIAQLKKEISQVSISDELLKLFLQLFSPPLKQFSEFRFVPTNFVVFVLMGRLHCNE